MWIGKRLPSKNTRKLVYLISKFKSQDGKLIDPHLGEVVEGEGAVVAGVDGHLLRMMLHLNLQSHLYQ